MTPPAYVLDGTDCDDSNADTYPNAPEYCDGVDSNCNDVLDDDSALDAPLWYTDLDGDGFGSPSTVVIACDQPTGFVSDGSDCNDFSSEQHPGAEELCNQQDDNCDSQIDEGVLSAFYLDVDGDGLGDCVFSVSNAIQVAPNEYFCDSGIFLGPDIGPDFVLIPAGDDPLGRFSISFDYYMMTTEVTVAMYDMLLGTGQSTSSMPKATISWHTAALFANALSALMGTEQCYDCTGTCTEAIDPIQCTGYRLPSEAEWEYAARSGTTKDFWTGGGADLGGNYDFSNCDGFTTILDGVSNPLVGDYAWYCGNTISKNPVAQKLPNGYGLYDMHGNVTEMTLDYPIYSNTSFSTDTPGGLDPLNLTPASIRVARGGSYQSYPSSLNVNQRHNSGASNAHTSRGFRLVLRAP